MHAAILGSGKLTGYMWFQLKLPCIALKKMQAKKFYRGLLNENDYYMGRKQTL